MEAELPEQGSWHHERKKAILAKHPEVKQLYGHNPWSFVIMLFAVITQTYVGICMVNCSWITILISSYTFGAYLSWACMTMGHEGSHGLVSPIKAVNKIHSITAFLPVFTGPFGTFWAIEHMFHHQVVVDKMNRYGPQQNAFLKKAITTVLFINIVSILFSLSSFVAFGRIILNGVMYLLGQRATPFPTSYKLRPYSNFPQVANSMWFIINMLAIIVFNTFIISKYGWTPVIYYFLCNGAVNGLHPLGMRQVQEHYMQRKGQPTNSVYSSFSFFLFNLGYHNEHHDFPTIPWNRLPKLRNMAPEFYDSLFYYESYTAVMIEFFTNPGIPYTILLDDFKEDDANPSNGSKKKN